MASQPEHHKSFLKFSKTCIICFQGKSGKLLDAEMLALFFRRH